MRKLHVCFLNPQQGEAPLRWAALPKSEAIIGGKLLRPSVAGMRQYPSLTLIRGRFPGAAHHALVRCRPGIHWGGFRTDTKTVIASEAKQSMLLQKGRSADLKTVIAIQRVARMRAR